MYKEGGYAKHIDTGKVHKLIYLNDLLYKGLYTENRIARLVDELGNLTGNGKSFYKPWNPIVNTPKEAV